MAYSTVTNNCSPRLSPTINDGALTVCIPLKVLNHFTLRSVHNSQTQHSQTRIAQWHELGIQSRSKQQLHKLIARYQLNTPINFEALTLTCPRSSFDRLTDNKLQMQCIINLIHKLTLQCQRTYPNMQADGLSELTEQTIEDIIIWFEGELLESTQSIHLQICTLQLFHQLHGKINNYSADYRTVDFCLLDVRFMHRLSNKEKTVYVAIVLKLVASSKGIAIMNHPAPRGEVSTSLD